MKKVGVLRGGHRKHHHSIKRGAGVLSHIFENHSEKYKTLDIFVDKNGQWHLNGLPVKPAHLSHRVDVVWNTADPHFTAMLRELAVPVISSPLYFEGILDGVVRMPRSIFYPASPAEVFQKFPAPWVVGNPDSIRIAKTFDDLAACFESGVSEVTEFILGTVGASHGISDFRGDDIYVVADRNFNTTQKKEITALTRAISEHLGNPHYIKADFVIHPKRGVYLTSLDFHPDLRAGSHLEQSLHSVGAKLEHLVEHILERTLR